MNKHILLEANRLNTHLGLKFIDRKTQSSRTPTLLFIGCLLLYIHLSSSYIHISFSLRHTRTKHSMWYIKRVFRLLCRFQSQSEIYGQHFALHTRCAHTHLNAPQTTAYGLMPWFTVNGPLMESGTRLELNQRQSSECGLFGQILNIMRELQKSQMSLYKGQCEKQKTQKCTQMCVTHATLFFFKLLFLICIIPWVWLIQSAELGDPKLWTCN